MIHNGEIHKNTLEAIATAQESSEKTAAAKKNMPVTEYHEKGGVFQMSMMDAVRSDLDRAFRAREMFPPIAFDPYAEAEPACTCGVCGSPVCEGERIYYDSKTNCLIGCEHCVEYRLA